MKLIIASNNEHKIKEIKEILGDEFSEVLSMKEAGIDLDVLEDGKTFEENAAKKAHAVLSSSDADAALADDSGLIVDALNGAPGIYSARFAGDEHNDVKNNEKLLKLMENIDDDVRTARFACAMVLARPNMKDMISVGFCEGKILREEIGDNGFGYDPLFFHEGYGRSFAELTSEEKNKVSHRRIALNGLKDQL